MSQYRIQSKKQSYFRVNSACCFVVGLSSFTAGALATRLGAEPWLDILFLWIGVVAFFSSAALLQLAVLERWWIDRQTKKQKHPLQWPGPLVGDKVYVEGIEGVIVRVDFVTADGTPLNEG
jgi:hypothetical protein